MRVESITGPGFDLSAPDIERDADVRRSWWLADPLGVRFLHGTDDPSGRDEPSQISGELKSLHDYTWMIVLAGRTAGFIALSTDRKPPGAAAVRYYVTPQYREWGVATASLGLVIDYAREVLHLTTILADVLADNAASRALLKRFNFRRSGPPRIDAAGMWHDFQRSL